MHADGARGRATARRWMLVLGAWTGVAAFSVAQIWVARTALGHPPPLGPLLLLEGPVWLFWAMMTVPIVMLARRFPLDRTRIAVSLGIHAPLAVAVATLAVAFQMLWYQAFNPYPILSTPAVPVWFWQFFRQYFVVGFMVYWAVLGVSHAFSNYVRYREREMEASRAKAQLGEARLRALRMQLHPHFLFNALNSVSALVEDHPAEARRVVAQLADLLRTSLRTDALHLVPLEEEVRFVCRYLDIERVRFGDRLDVRVRVDPETRRAAVPSFLFQPLVENAVRHGIARRETPGRVWLTAERRNGSLVVHVMDDGPGAPSWPAREGIGLANTRERLRELYGTEQALTLGRRTGGGVDARVEIPFRPVEARP